MDDTDEQQRSTTVSGMLGSGSWYYGDVVSSPRGLCWCQIWDLAGFGSCAPDKQRFFDVSALDMIVKTFINS